MAGPSPHRDPGASPDSGEAFSSTDSRQNIPSLPPPTHGPDLMEKSSQPDSPPGDSAFSSFKDEDQQKRQREALKSLIQAHRFELRTGRLILDRDEHGNWIAMPQIDSPFADLASDSLLFHETRKSSFRRGSVLRGRIQGTDVPPDDLAHTLYEDLIFHNVTSQDIEQNIWDYVSRPFHEEEFDWLSERTRENPRNILSSEQSSLSPQSAKPPIGAQTDPDRAKMQKDAKKGPEKREFVYHYACNPGVSSHPRTGALVSLLRQIAHPGSGNLEYFFVSSRSFSSRRLPTFKKSLSPQKKGAPEVF